MFPKHNLHPHPIFSQTLHLPAVALDLLTLLCASHKHTITPLAFEFVSSDENGGRELQLPLFVCLYGESFR